MKAGYRKGAKGEDLAAVIAASGPFSYMILMQGGDIWFTDFDNATNWAVWEQGVVFGPDCELRWRRRRGGTFHLVSLCQNLPSGFMEVGEAGSIGKSQFYLWGERVFDDQDKPIDAWLEGRIPQIITGKRGYPLPASGAKPPLRIALEVELLELTPPPEIDDDFSPPRCLERFIKPVEISQ